MSASIKKQKHPFVDISRMRTKPNTNEIPEILLDSLSKIKNKISKC